jgi:glutaredoxin
MKQILINMILKKPIRTAFICLCFVAFYFFTLRGSFTTDSFAVVEGPSSPINNSTETNKNRPELAVFVQDGCPHCINAEKYLSTNPYKGKVNVVYYNLKDAKNRRRLAEATDIFGIPKTEVGTPFFMIGKRYVLGFSERSRAELDALISNVKD